MARDSVVAVEQGFEDSVDIGGLLIRGMQRIQFLVGLKRPVDLINEIAMLITHFYPYWCGNEYFCKTAGEMWDENNFLEVYAMFLDEMKRIGIIHSLDLHLTLPPKWKPYPTGSDKDVAEVE